MPATTEIQGENNSVLSVPEALDADTNDNEDEASPMDEVPTIDDDAGAQESVEDLDPIETFDLDNSLDPSANRYYPHNPHNFIRVNRRQ